jgi:hypothetical protein
VVYFQLRKLSQQITLQNFSDYTKRYQSIILHFPEDVNVSDFVLKGRADYDQTMRYLHRNKLIDLKIWSVWRSGIATALSKPSFQQAWQIVKADTRFGPDFEAFMDQCMRGEFSTQMSRC